MKPSHAARVCALSAAVVIAPPRLAQASSDEAGEPAPFKDHVLFVGLDCQITHDGKVYSVRDVRRSKVVLEGDGTVAPVPIQDLERLEVRPHASVAAAQMTVHNLRHERAYSVLANPEIEAQRAQQAMADAASVRMDFASYDATGGMGQAINQTTAHPTTVFNYLAQLEQAQAEFSVAADDYFVGPVRDLSSFQDMVTEEDQHDVLLINFEAWAPAPIPDAYAVSMTEYTTPDNREEPAIALHLSDLPWIGTKPRRVTIRQINFPRGFLVNDVKVHIFSRGKEIASNLSEKTTPVSKGEALLFLKMSHLNRHKQQDAAPALVRELIPPSLILPEHLDLSGQSVILSLDEDGNPESLPDTLKDGQPIDPGIQSLLAKAHFYPALENGVPAPSRIEFFLESLFH